MKSFDFYVKQANQALLANTRAAESLKLFSVSESDYKMRVNAYTNAMARTSQMEDMALAGGARRRMMTFASPGMGAGNLRGSTIYPATILSNVSSIAPIFSVERDMDTPNGDLQFMDFYNIIDNKQVLPNLGRDGDFGENIKNADLSSLLSSAEVEYQSASSFIPHSIKLTLVHGGVTYAITDNGAGTLLAAPGLLSAGTVNYSTGAVNITFAEVKTGGTLKLTAAMDLPSDNAIDKIGGESKYFHVTTEPIIIPLQRNIVTDAAMNKQGVLDPNELYANVIQSTYTKKINEKVVSAIVNAYEGDSYTADLSEFNLAGGRYDTFIRSFQSLLVDGEATLGEKTYKAAKVNGILAGAKIANVFQYMNEGEGWIPNNSLGYFKDLLGWYNGIPVVRWTNNSGDAVRVGDYDLYLTHKTEDGQLAPVVRGMFLSPTDLPEIANFANPTQITNGMFSLEGVRPTTSKLAVKLTITLPESQMLKKA